MQVGVSPAWVSADAVEADHAAAFVGKLQGLCSAHSLKERIQVSLQLGHERVIIATSEETEKVMHAGVRTKITQPSILNFKKN